MFLRVARRRAHGWGNRGARPPWDGQLGAGNHQIGVADSVELNQPFGAGAEAIGDFRERFPTFHRVSGGGQGLGGRRGSGVAGAGNDKPLTGDHQVWIGDAVGLHQTGEADAIGCGDGREGVAWAHCDAGARRTGPAGSWQHQLLAGHHQVWVGNAVGLHQLGQADPIALGDLREGFAWFDHHVRQTRQRQHHR